MIVSIIFTKPICYLTVIQCVVQVKCYVDFVPSSPQPPRTKLKAEIKWTKLEQNTWPLLGQVLSLSNAFPPVQKVDLLHQTASVLRAISAVKTSGTEVSNEPPINMSGARLWERFLFTCSPVHHSTAHLSCCSVCWGALSSCRKELHTILAFLSTAKYALAWKVHTMHFRKTKNYPNAT